MKTTHILLMLLAAMFTVSCSNDPIDGLTGRYDMDRYVFNVAEQQPTVKMKKNIKALNMKLTDGTNTAELTFGSSEWTLKSGTYKPETKVNADKQYSLTINGKRTVASGDMDVTIVGNTYYLNLLGTDSTGKPLKVDFKGSLTFEQGVDDPEASGYILTIKENTVTDADNKTYPELTKYAISISSPEGNDVAEFDAVNQSGLGIDDLVGTYTIQSYPTESGLMDNGWVVYMPEYNYGMAGGTYFTDSNGAKQYVTKGQITITKSIDSEGKALYSFSGNGLETLNAKNEAGKGGSFTLPFTSYVKVKGTVLKDRTLHSDVLGMDMKYSVYLPESWDGVKKFPVLYMLHGADGGNNDWLTGGRIDVRLSAAITAGTAPEMIIIMPNCTVNGKNLFYVDGYQGDAKYMTYFFNEFLPTVEKKYCVQADRSHRMIGGLSMGGYGSLYYGALHPEMFSYVYACSPATFFDGVPKLDELLNADLKDGKEIPGITIEIGTSDFLFQTAASFKQYLDGAGIKNEYITRTGAHDWAFWQVCTPKVITKAATVFQQK